MREVAPDPAARFVDPDRLGRVRAAVADADVDGLLAFSPANSYYLSGAYAGMYSRPVAALVTETESAFVGPSLELRKAARTAWVDRVVVYEDADDPIDTIASVVRDAEAGRLGVDRGYARPDWVASVENRVETALTDATDLLLSLRAVKTEWERAMMRRASDLATAGMEAYLDAVAAGTPEITVVDAIQDAYYETYLERHPEFDIGTANELGQYGFASALSGEHALEPHSISSAREIADGESVVGIALPSVQGYVCEEERTVLVGDVPAHVEAAMETLVEVRRGTMERLRAGTPTAEVDAWTADALREAGYGDQLIHRTGHGEGITIHEGPAMNAAAPEGDLEPGMVMSVEPGLYFEDDDVALRHSDTFVVREDGVERLTDTPDGVLRA